jgi:hypothetical protein
MPSLNYQQSANGDSGYSQGAGFSSPNRYYCGSLGGTIYAFLRFTGVTIPVGATITAAYLSFYENASGGTPLTKIYAEDAADPAACTSRTDLYNRTKTTAVVDQDGNPAAGWYNTNDISSIIQELVNSYDYSAGKAIQFLHDNDGGGNGNYLEHESYFTTNSLAPKLHIEYTATSCALTGTVTASITEADVLTGGKTIILTLTGDTWVTTGATFDAQRQNIINGIDSAQAEATGWDAVVKAGLAVTDVVRTSDTVVTITLPAFASYNITAQETITATVPATALTGNAALVASPTFTIDPVTTSTVRMLACAGVGS